MRPDTRTPFAGRLAPRPEAPARTAEIHRLPAARAAPQGPVTNDPASRPCASPVVVARLLGPFEAQVNGRPVEDLPHRKAKAILKYLLLHRGRPVAKEVLMETFWPAAAADAARNSLNVAIHRLRCALPGGAAAFPFVRFTEGHYALDPALRIWTDVDGFAARVERAAECERAGDLHGALREYAAGAALYRGELLAEDRYAEWVLPLRRDLHDRHLQALDRLSRIQFEGEDYRACIASCTRILAVDACEEPAHRLLMRCYARSGQPQAAHRQYQACVHALRSVLNLAPSAETTELYRRLVRG